jgi:spore maturation protein CgeB
MKVLVVGTSFDYALELIYIKYLKPHVKEIDLYATNALWLDNKSLIGKIGNRLLKKYFHYKINKNLIEKVNSFKPDIVWVFKGTEIAPETLKHIKQVSNTKLVNYNPDHPFIRVFYSSGGKNVEECVPFYDLHFCYSADLCKEITTKFNIPTIQLPFGFELSEAHFLRASAEKEIVKAAFVGNPDKDRTHLISTLAANNIPIDVYGYDWHKWLKPTPFVQIFDGIIKEDFWKTLRKYRLQLNVFRPHNINSHNMRSFEIPSVGGIQLAPDSEEHRAFFTPQKDIFLYSSTNDMIIQAKYLLSLPKDAADLIRQSAHTHSIECGYAYEQRAKTVFQTFSKLLN